MRLILELVRIPNSATAAADVIAAYALAGAFGELSLLTSLAPLLLASVCFYCGGMALNDVADAELDAVERSTRPIPSGRIRRATAAIIGLTLLAAGIALAATQGRAALSLGVTLALAILAYDFYLAGRPLLGPLGMALCRMLNWLLPLAAFGAAAARPGAELGIDLSLAPVAVASIGIYVFGLTHLSLGEVHGGARNSIQVAAATSLAAILCVVMIARGATMTTLLDQFAFVLPLATLVFMLGPAAWRAARNPSHAPSIGRLVGGLVGAIIYLDAALATAAMGIAWVVPFALLAGFHIALRRNFAVT